MKNESETCVQCGDPLVKLTDEQRDEVREAARMAAGEKV